MACKSGRALQSKNLHSIHGQTTQPKQLLVPPFYYLENSKQIPNNSAEKSNLYIIIHHRIVRDYLRISMVIKDILWNIRLIRIF